jgi:hypothetical protein
MRLAYGRYAFMQKLKPWLSSLPVMFWFGWMLCSAWVSQGSPSTVLLFLIFGVLSLGLYGVFWATEKIFDLMTGTKQNRQQADHNCSISDIGNLDFENIKFNIPAGNHAVVLSHLPNCEDIVSSCIEGVSSCIEGLQP